MSKGDSMGTIDATECGTDFDLPELIAWTANAPDECDAIALSEAGRLHLYRALGVIGHSVITDPIAMKGYRIVAA